MRISILISILSLLASTLHADPLTCNLSGYKAQSGSLQNRRKKLNLMKKSRLVELFGGGPKKYAR